jgi:hypothetical protein
MSDARTILRNFVDKPEYRMKRCILQLSCVLFFLGAPAGRSVAQANVTAHVFAEVVEAITASETAQLNFGRFYSTANGGKITISPDGIRSVTPDVTPLGMISAASFTVTGQVDATFSISLPTENATVTNLSNSKTMDVENWVSIPSAINGSGILTGGTQLIKVGATLVVKTSNDNPAGIYSGTYSVSFNYN